MSVACGDSTRQFPELQSEALCRSSSDVFADLVAAGRSSVSGPERGSSAGGEAAGTFNLSIEQNRNKADECEGWGVGEDRQEVSWIEVKARRCKCGVCPTCASGVAYRESQRVMAVIKNWRFPQMWTLTLNPRAYPDRRRILEWIKEKKCVATWVQSLWRKGLLNSRHYYAVMEFQDGSRNASGVGTDEVHFHVLLDTKGFINWEVAWELWERKAPEWRECGDTLNKHCPAMGFVRFDKVYEGDGLAAYLSKGVAGYLSKGVKNLPPWFVEYLDDGHNMRLKYASRGFFDALPKPERKYTRKPVASKPKKRRTVSERIAKCRHDADAYVIVDGKPVWLDRAAFDFENVLRRLEGAMTADQLEHARKVGRVAVSAAELVRVCGVDTYGQMVRKYGRPVGGGVFTKIEREVLEARGLPVFDFAGDGSGGSE